MIWIWKCWLNTSIVGPLPNALSHFHEGIPEYVCDAVNFFFTFLGFKHIFIWILKSKCKDVHQLYMQPKTLKIEVDMKQQIFDWKIVKW